METLTIVLAYIVIGFCVVVIIWAILMLIRNERVYKFRKRVLETNYQTYRQLPSYDQMLNDGKPLKLESYINTSERNLKSN